MSFGPPIPPSPHLLPYLYPGMYAGGSGLGGPLCPPALSPTTNLLFNAQLALAAHHPGSLFTQAYLQGAAATGNHPFKMSGGLSAAAAAAGLGRFHPYHLGLHHHPASSVGSAFETVTPGRCSSAGSTPPLAPLDLQSPPAANGGAVSLRRSSSPPSLPAPPSLPLPPPPPPPPSSQPRSAPAVKSPPPPPRASSNPTSELKSIEKMVNGLDSSTTAAPVAAAAADEHQQQTATAVK